MPDALRVFISYSSADSKDFADRLEKDLKAQQSAPWVDRHGLQGGQAWLEAIQHATDASQALVVVLSPASVQSQYVHMEYHYAQKEGKLVIPIMERAVKIPMDLLLTHCLVDFQPGYEDGLRQLVQALRRLQPPEPTDQNGKDVASKDNRDQWWAVDGRISHLKSAIKKQNSPYWRPFQSGGKALICL